MVRARFGRNAWRATPAQRLASAQAATRAFAEDLNAWLAQQEGLDGALEWAAAAAGFHAAWVEELVDGSRRPIAVTSLSGTTWEDALRPLYERLQAERAPDGVDRIRWLTLEQLSPALRAAGFRSVVLTPLGTEPHQQGWLGMASADTQRPSVERRAVIDTLAQTLGLALVARRLLTEHKEHARIATLLATMSSLNEGADSLGHELRMLVDHDEAALQLHDPGSSVVQVWRMWRSQSRRESIPGTNPDEEAELARNEEYQVKDLLCTDGPHEPLVVPLHVREHRVGLLALGRRTGGFDSTEENKLFGIAPVLASAVERMRLEERLRAAEQAATLGGVSRMLAHEVRNPLNGLALHVQLLKRRVDRLPVEGEEQQAIDEHIEVLRREVSRLDSLVHDYLGLSRGVPLRLQAVDLGEMLDELRSVYEPTAQQRGIALDIQVGCRPATATVDRTKIMQVLHNLVGNAVEALEGRANAKVEVVLHGSRDAWQIRVRDNGPGIGDDTSRIFQPGYSSKPLGGGMGLAISRHIMSLHDGRLMARRPDSGGTEMVLTLRSTPPDEGSPNGGSGLLPGTRPHGGATASQEMKSGLHARRGMRPRRDSRVRRTRAEAALPPGYRDNPTGSVL